MYYIPLNQPIEPAFLDGLLEMGWYRMSQHVFTTRFVHLSPTVSFEVLWARINLAKWHPTSRHLKLLNKAKKLQFVLKDAEINSEIESLFLDYKSEIDFNPSQSVRDFLQDGAEHNFFPTRMWQVYDQQKLIAASYFDEGKSSVAGIMSFFHPQYKKYSLGLLVYLQSVQWAAQNGKEFFYPGYIALHHTKFDYKLQAGESAIEIWEPQGMEWIDYALSTHATQQTDPLQPATQQ
jgi:arginine-tRNA-protein transferase